MGEHFTTGAGNQEALRNFTRLLLKDIHVLEQLLEEDRIEKGVRRIGAEQELVLVQDGTWRPAPIADRMLGHVQDPHFTTELARFNLEFNLDPLEFGGDCLSRLEADLNHYLHISREAAAKEEATVALVGILPTIRQSDLTLENMTPAERYAMLNEILTKKRGKNYELNIKGTDELSLTHDNIMLEACNTSFQVHFQVSPEEFARRYNIAQVVTAPILAAAVNSPMLGRYRLWRETRIALFQQSLDTRKRSVERDLQPRVSFGTKWVENSILEIYQEDIARFKVLFAIDEIADPHEQLQRGEAPSLDALRLHTGTVYRWNRPCYGVGNGVPHLRIENRVLPAGPTVIDEVANATFWFGLMAELGDEYEDITDLMEFEVAKDNFIAAARHGLDAQFTWIDGKRWQATDLILKELLPRAEKALRSRDLRREDVDRYLGVVEERVGADMTGSTWLLKSLQHVKQAGTRWEQVNAIVAAMLDRQKQGDPVHTWPLARLEEAGGWKCNYVRIGQFMNTDIFTVQEHEPIDLVANLMVWHRIRHVMVEDDEHRLIGLVSHRRLLRLAGQSLPKQGGEAAPVSSIMVTDPITVTPETPTVEAIALMRENRISCLPVIAENRLVGVITEDDFVSMAGTLLEEKLNE